MNLPYSVLLEIFSYIPIQERWCLISICKLWYQAIHDPLLYKHIEFNNLEYATIIFSLLKLTRDIQPNDVKTLTINNCYSSFIQNTLIPVEYIHRTNNMNRPILYSHLMGLHYDRRKVEYNNHHFKLHGIFSAAMEQLLKSTNHSIRKIKITNCILDLEMTNLISLITKYCHSMHTFVYRNNHDKGIQSSDLLKKMVISCPNMKHFIGIHSGLNDSVLLTISQHWKNLKSISIGPTKKLENPNRYQLTAGSFSELLTRCKKLINLELYDLPYITNQDLQDMYYRPRMKPNRYQPYSKKRDSSIKNLKVTKFMTSPLSKPGFEYLVKLFPDLNRLEYDINYYTFDNLYHGITRDMFFEECKTINEWFQKEMKQLTFLGHWNTSTTNSQIIMAGASTSTI